MMRGIFAAILLACSVSFANAGGMEPPVADVYPTQKLRGYHQDYQSYRKPRVAKARYGRRVAVKQERRTRGGWAVSKAGIVPELVAKGDEIVAACGSRVISGRDARARRSNHPIGRAIDVQGNPRCIYAHLRGWRGGYSVDYHTAPNAKHVHISWNPGGMEWAARFHHRNPYRYARRNGWRG